MLFRQLFDSESSTYTYLLADPLSRDAALIDPVLEKIEVYLQLIEQLELRLGFALDTHVHADHVTALGRLRELTKCVTVMGRETGADCVSQTVRDGEILQVGSLELRALYTPGHTDDSYSFYLPAGGRVFTGDTLLIRGTGRTDFQNGDPVAQYASLFKKLLRLPDETLVYPAHDYRGWTVSTIAEERRWNPRLQVQNAAEYSEIMNSLNLPNPKMMDVAVPANQRCGRE